MRGYKHETNAFNLEERWHHTKNDWCDASRSSFSALLHEYWLLKNETSSKQRQQDLQ